MPAGEHAVTAVEQAVTTMLSWNRACKACSSCSLRACPCCRGGSEHAAHICKDAGRHGICLPDRHAGCCSHAELEQGMQTMPIVQCPSAPVLQGRTRASSSHLPGRSQIPSLRAPPIRCSLPVRLRPGLLPQQTRTTCITTTTTNSAPEQPASLRWTRAGPGSPHPS